jgi:hypothetical protein
MAASASTRNTSRRRLLAALAATPMIGAAAVPSLATALPAAATPAAQDDPIFAAIAEWRTLYEGFRGTLSVSAKLHHDHPEHDAAEALTEAASDTELDARCKVYSIVPETPAGLLALIDVFVENSGIEWFDELEGAPLNSIFAATRKLLGDTAI